MEHYWSRAGATRGNRSQTELRREPPRRDDPQPFAAHGNPASLDGKQGVDRHLTQGNARRTPRGSWWRSVEFKSSNLDFVRCKVRAQPPSLPLSTPLLCPALRERATK